MRHNLLRCARLLGALSLLLGGGVLHARPQTPPAVQERPPAIPAAQERPIAIKGAKLLLGDGTVIENGTIVMSGGKIQEMGTDVRIPQTATVIDGAGKIVTPGFIDARSALLLDFGSIAVSGSDPVRATADSVNRFASNQIKEALENGVTTIGLAPTQGTGIAGRGVVMKLKGERAQVLKDAAFLAINLEPWLDLKPVNALREFLETKRGFEEARKYREQWQTYEQELEEYVKKVKELEEKEKAEKEKAEKGKEEKPKDDKAKDEKPKADEKPGDKKDEKAPEKKPEPPKRLPLASWIGTTAAESVADDTAATASDDGWFFDEPKPAGGDEKKPEAGGDKKDEKLKKPDMPAKDEGKEILLKALDRKLTVFFGAQRAEAIQNALDLIKDLHLRGVIAGGEHAHRLKGAIAEADVPVILGPVVRSEEPPASCFRGHDPAAAAILAHAKVRLALASSGADPNETRFLPLTCAAAVGNGVVDGSALAMITSRAAELLGVQDRVGTLAKGKDADVLIFNADPLGAGAMPATVIVDGQVVVQAAAPAAAGK